MSGPYGPITMEGSRPRATECDQQHVKIADSTCAKEDLTTYKEKVDQVDSTILKKPTPDNNPKFQPAEDTNKVDFVPGDSTQQFIIGAGLSDKYECALNEFLRENRDIFAWKPSDMSGVPRELVEHQLNTD